MNYNNLTHEEKMHIEEVYSVVADALNNNFKKYNSIIVKKEEDELIVCNILASMIKYDTILQKIGIKVLPYDEKGLFIVHFNDTVTKNYFISDIIRYL